MLSTSRVGVGAHSVWLVPAIIIATALAHVSCARCSPHGRDADTPEGIRVPFLTSSGRITPDGELGDWKGLPTIATIRPGDAARMQWSCIRGESPQPTREGDFAATVYMAWDDARWYIAARIEDDVVRGVSAQAQDLYSGDSFEVFFAGAETDSANTIQTLVENPLKPDQAAFLQLVLSPETHLEQLNHHVPSYRTDARVSSSLLSATAGGRFAVASQSGPSGWTVEAAIPFEAFDASVQAAIRVGGRLKANFDYLDYDGILPAREEPHWGFKPDNVFCPDDDEDHVTKPQFMRPLMFEK